jgi:hypothetical protein
VAATCITRHGCSFIRSLPQRALVGLPRRALPPSPAALHAFAPCATHLRGSHLRCSLPRCLWHAADPATAAGAHVPWRLRSSLLSQGHPRAWPVLVVLARRGSPPAPTLMVGINWPDFPFPMLHMYVSSVSDVLDVCCISY